jgi:predicted acyltransferase (DUF342 family)
MMGMGTDVATSARHKAVRRLAGGLTLGMWLAAAPAHGDVATPPGDPAAFVFSANGNLYVGNSTRVPGPVACNGTMLLDERVQVTSAVARRDLKLRLLALVTGDALSMDGGAQLMNQVRIVGDLAAERSVVVGVTARVDGAVTSTSGDVRLVRQSMVLGDVYADGEFRGDRDVRVGTAGSRVEVRGDAIIRDRSEYFASILYEGEMSVLGVGQPVFHAPVTQMSPGTLAAPSLPAWKLDSMPLDAASPSSSAVSVTSDMGPTPLPPGRYGTLSIGQEAVVVLSPGVYDFDQIVAQSDARIQVQLPADTDTVTLRVRRDVKPGRRVAMDVMTNDAALRRSRAARILTVTGGSFRGDQDVVWAGAILTGKDLYFGKHTTFRGAAWSKGNLFVSRDSVLEWVPLPAD